MFNIPTANMLPPYYSYTQMMEREQQIYQKLNSIEEILEEAHLLADMTIHAKKEEERLVKQIADLENACNIKTNCIKNLEKELKELQSEIKAQESRCERDSKMIRSLEVIVKEREFEMERLQRKLDRMIRRDHRLVMTLFLLLLIVLVVGCFDMVVMFIRLI